MVSIDNIFLKKAAVVSFFVASINGCTTLPPEVEQLMSIGQTTFFQENESWRGNYVCDGKSTAMAFDILDVRNNRFLALIHFEEKNKTKGVYVISGQSIGNTVRTSPLEWKIKPPGYSMLGFMGTYDESRKTVKGSVNNPGCSTFSMKLTNKAPLPIRKSSNNRIKPPFINNKVD